MRDLRVPKIVKENKCVAVRGKLEPKTCFQRQPFTNYLRLNLVSI